MNLYKQFVKEKGLKADYVEWLERKVSGDNEPEIGKRAIVADTFQNTSFYDDNGILIDYSCSMLGYEVEVVLPRLLSTNEETEVNGIIEYWSHLPYVSVEGNYGIEWKKYKNKDRQKVIISIDFTKSASDDYGARQILELLGEYIMNGTPYRKRTKDQKWRGVCRPVSVKSGSM